MVNVTLLEDVSAEDRARLEVMAEMLAAERPPSSPKN
jgi:hypothetical protein